MSYLVKNMILYKYINRIFYFMDNGYDQSSYDNFDIITQMANTIDALNTNIILLNRFISSAYNLTNNSNNFNENVEITTFDSSGNIVACVKSDGAGNFLPCTHMDLSGNFIPCVLPPMPAGLTGPHVHINKPTKTKDFLPYPYYPYYNPYYPYWPQYDYYNTDNSDNVDDNCYRGVPIIKKPPTVIPKPILHKPILNHHPILPPPPTMPKIVHVHVHP
jgi:hypothetical protein